METDVTQQLKILIIEDDIVDRKLLQRLLSQSALPISDIKSAECLATAFGFLDKEHFDVVFLDLGLPDSQGIESFNAIYAKTQGAPIVVVSGLDDEKTAIMAVKKGVQDYLVKGQVDSNLLTRTVRYAIERKKAEEQLRQAEEKYRMQFEGALDAIFVADVETGIIIDCNPAATRLVGREKLELIGQHQRILHPPETVEGEFSSTFKQHLKEKEGQTVETQIITKTGEIKNVAIMASVLEVGGKKVLQGIFRDITERKKAEQERQLAENKYRTIFENSAVSISLVDEQERLISWNKFTEHLLGMNKEDLYFRQVKSLYPEGQWQKIRALNIRQKGLQRHLETKMVRKNGVLIDVDVSLSVLKNPEGKVIGSIGVVTDITERKRAEEELKEAMETKSQFISTVSHELRTPLAPMKEAISIVLDEVAGKINKDQRNFLNIAQRNIDRLARLINEVLDFQKLSASKMKFNMHENDIREVVKDACHTMTLYAEKKKVTLSVKFDDDLPKARFDSDGIMQVLTNLVSNAIKFTPEKGQVTVLVQHKEEDLVIQVSDTGIGVSKENLPKLFTPFYQIHQPGQQTKGTGLGLAIVSKIVTTHGGRIEVESEVGCGTTFTVFLPIDGKPAPEILPERMDKLLEDTVVDSQSHTR